MNAKEVLAAVRAKHNKCAIVAELVVNDAERLAAYRTWIDAGRPQGDSASDDFFASTSYRRIDALMFDGNSTRTALEVKVSRADFKRETEAKRRPWELITNRFVYVTPAGLIQPDEVPAHCGLWWVDDSALEARWTGSEHIRVPTVSVVKKAKTNKTPDPIPHQVIVAMAYRLGRQVSGG
ncbi:hypothetical protein [Rhodococcoides fascians]|uniref:hypothetical protein n=1 Tax=Rhodococcoides fascians TaxID=1828 RepID=UPI00050C501A|nr:hypothetical protein [Rhodococcus fascians]